STMSDTSLEHLFNAAKLSVSTPENPPDADGRPPAALVTFLTFLQVALEASYISPAPDPLPAGSEHSSTQLLGPPPPGRPGAKPRPGSSLKPRPPPLQPPQTPNPTPQSAESDKQYAIAEGIQLNAFIWGESMNKETRKDEFALVWDESTREWVAVYRMDTTIDKPLVITPARRPIFDLIQGESDSLAPAHQTSRAPTPFESDSWGLEEINLLDGLSSGTTFPRAEGTSPLPSSPTTARTSRPILRKAFRKTLSTCNGFHVRMRTIYVPYVLIPGVGDDEEERREAGSEERSVVLCVEIENTGESLKDFEVSAVKVAVSGEGASSRLISWGESQAKMDPESVFPLRLRPIEQYNLLYSVTFLHPTNVEDQVISRKMGQAPQMLPPSSDLQRSVSIVISGRPCEVLDGEVKYVIDTFNSKWNCVLNLSPHQQPDMGDYQLNEPLSVGDALPTPASPFPVSTPRIQTEFERNHPISTSRSPTIGGSKRHTVTGLSGRRNTIPSPIKVRFSLPVGITATSTPSTSGMKPGIPAPPLSSVPSTPSTANPYLNIPATPAYPAWSPDAQSVPPTPYQSAPFIGQIGNAVGKLVEPHRDRRMGLNGALLPSTPGPAAFIPTISERITNLEPYSEPVVVSVALLSPIQATGSLEVQKRTQKRDWIYPLDIFALEIFVFNQSPVTRRFEVSLPDRKRHRKQLLEDKRRSAMQEQAPSNFCLLSVFIALMAFRPLRPETCQSVRMQFIALRPGLHSVDTLTITDTEAEFSLNLRYSLASTRPYL
ncbi:13360_t:CDS:2, partial [Acaulospora colombiana]